MSSHLYNSALGRVRWFVRRFGVGEVFWKPLRLILAPLIIPFLRPTTFQFRNRTFSCFFARYNTTWAGERMVELPIGKALLDEYADRSVLEVGQVLSHYFPVRHSVVDKYEQGPGVQNIDILDYSPSEQFDLILSISTFEHIGFDDDTPTSSGEKVRAAIVHCQRLLTPEGKLVITFPTGYNPDLDSMLRERCLGASRLDFLLREARRNWRECDLETALAAPYRSRFPYGNALVVVEFSRLEPAPQPPPAGPNSATTIALPKG